MKDAVRLFRPVLASLLLASLLLTGLPNPASAAPNTTVGTLSLVPAFEQISVYSSFSNDDNANASAYVEYRQVGTTQWKRGVDLTPDRRDQLAEFDEAIAGPRWIPNPYKGQFRGIIFGLQTRTQYEVRVTYVDPDGVTGSPATATITTRDDNPPSSGPTKPATPSTLATVLAGAQPGDIISLAPGTYTGGIDVVASGLPNNYITIQSADTNNKAVISGGGWNIRLMGNYIRLRGLDLRAPTGDPAPNVAVGWSDGNVATGNIIEDSIMTDPNNVNWASAGVLLRNSKNTLIQRNLMQTTAIAARGQSYGIFFWGTGAYGGNVIRNNNITSEGTFRDSIGGSGNFQVGAGPGPDSFIYNNYLYGSYDDGIESEGGNMNVAIFNNTIKNNNQTLDAARMVNGIGIASVVVGPLYAVRNTMISPREGTFKVGSSSYGTVYLYHNISYLSGYGLIFTSGNNRIAENYVVRNNITQGTGRVMGHYTDTIPLAQQTDTFDYDILYASGDWFGFWYGIRYETLAALKSGSTHEQHSIDTNPSFVNPGAGDFTLQAASPAIDAGVLIPGVNNADSPWPYQGAAPDIGVFEYGSGPPVNQPPVLAAIGNKSVTAGQLLTFTISATDPNGDTLTYSASNLPSGSTFNAGTRSFSWTPTTGQVGTYANVTFQVSDGSLTDSESITITVSAPDTTPPVISSVQATGITANSATITWTTNELSDSQVNFGITTGLGTLTPLNTTQTTTHSINLSSLAASTPYYYVVISKDGSNNSATSSQYTFTTTASVPVTAPPQQIHLSFGQSGADTTVIVTWATVATGDSLVQYGTTPSYGSQKTGTSFSSSATGYFIHSAELTGLAYNTTYYYRVGGATGWSGQLSFISPPQKGSTGAFTLAALSDYQKSYDPTIKNLIKSYQPKFVLDGGDLVHDGTVQTQYDDRLNLMEDLINNAPYMPALGNHEYYDPTAQKYFGQFTLPNNERWYSFNYGNTHFVSLEVISTSQTIDPGSAQYVWLQNDLQQASADPQIKWKVLYFHVPIYSSGSGDNYGGNTALRSNLEPLFNQYGVDVVLSGHYHNYERTYMVADNGVIIQTGPNFTKGAKGTVHAVIGGANGGGNALDPLGAHTWTALYSISTNFAVLTIDNNSIGFKALDASNNIIDQFTIAASTTDTTPPIRSNGQPTGTLASGTTSATLSLTTSENATVRYSTTAGTAYSAMTNTFSTTGGTTHSTLVTGLADGNTYTYYVRAQDAAGNANTDDFAITFSVASSAPGGATTPGTLSLAATIKSIGVIAAFSGDSNGNNQATLEYREAGSAVWKPGTAMTVDRRDILTGAGSIANPYKNQWRSSVFWLKPDTTYEVKVTYADADGIVGANSVTASVRTRKEVIPIGTGTNYYVSTTGSDTNPGTEAAPFRTIQKAANTVQSGGTVYIKAGTYNESVTVSASGADTNNYIIFSNFGTDEVWVDSSGLSSNNFALSGNYIMLHGIKMRNAWNSGVYITGSNNRVEYSRIEEWARRGDTGYADDWLYAGIMLYPGTNSTINDNTLYKSTGYYTFANSSATGNAGVGMITVRNTGTGTGGGHVIARNRLETTNGQVKDGITTAPEGVVYGGLYKDTDIYDNVIINAFDDAIQAEGGDINVRIWGNTLQNDANSGLAMSPAVVGPMYFLRNVMINNANSGGVGAFKTGSGGSGRVYAWHNTIYNSQSGGKGPAYGGGTGFDGIEFKNNIVFVTSYAYNFYNTAYDRNNMGMDYNSLQAGATFARWWNTAYGTLAAFSSGTGQDVHSVTGNPQFVNAAAGNFNLQSTSPSIDKGTVLVQINDADSPWPYQGAAPDAGAFEYASGPPTNQPPVLAAIGNKSVTEGQLLSFTISATDPNGDPLTYSASGLPSGASFSASTRTFSWTPATGQAGSYPSVYFQVSDGSLVDSESITITVSAPAANQPPVLAAIGNKSVTEGQLLQFTISATDPNGDPLTYSASGLPSGASFSASTRTFSWTPATGQAGSYPSVYFQVSDGSLVDSESITITVNAPAANQPPVLAAIGNKSVTEGQLLSFTISAADPNGDPLTYSASNLPSGASFNAGTRTFSWTPATGQAGTYPNIYFQVSDGSLTDLETITITVNAPAANQPPVLAAIGNKSVTEGQLLSFTISATDPNGDPLTYSASNLPSGAIFSASTRTFSWTPATGQAGPYPNVYFQVSDGALVASENITITVNAATAPSSGGGGGGGGGGGALLPPPNASPVLGTIGNKSVSEGQLLPFTVSATDSDGDTLTYSASNLPPGASFDSQTRTFSWTPATGQAGTYSGVHFEVSDGKIAVSEDITITVNKPVDTAPQISTVTASEVTSSSVVVRWTTNEPSTSQVEYWASPSKLSPLDERLLTDHVVQLTGLASGTTYHYKTMSKDAAGNLATSAENTFTTLGTLTAFTVSQLQITPSEVFVRDEVTISVVVANTGETAGTYRVMFSINGVLVNTTTVTLASGASDKAVFTTTEKAAGVYKVDVNGLADSFTVKEKSSGGPSVKQPDGNQKPGRGPKVVSWATLGIIIGVTLIVIIATVVIVLYRRREMLKGNTERR